MICREFWRLFYIFEKSLSISMALYSQSSWYTIFSIHFATILVEKNSSTKILNRSKNIVILPNYQPTWWLKTVNWYRIVYLFTYVTSTIVLVWFLQSTISTTNLLFIHYYSLPIEQALELPLMKRFIIFYRTVDSLAYFFTFSRVSPPNNHFVVAFYMMKKRT